MFAVRQFDPRTLAWWIDQRDEIEFNPPYQRRGGLWSESDQQFLIDSILNQYDIPKIYIADFTYSPSSLNTTNRRYAIIDGKQRLEAILRFADGEIGLSSKFVLADDPRQRIAGLGYRDLRKNYPKLASRFDNFNLTVMSVITDEEGRINQLFVRLNRNKTLTGPEIRNAMEGLLPELFRSIAEDEFFTSKVRFKISRGQDLDAAAKFLLVEFRGELVETKRIALDEFVLEGMNADAKNSDLTRAAHRVQRVLNKMCEVFIDRDPLLATQGALVPYYWLVREAPTEALGYIRPFLVDFDDRRRANRKLLANPEQVHAADATLARYETFSRSINDPGSLEGRYEILAQALSQYLDGRPPGSAA